MTRRDNSTGGFPASRRNLPQIAEREADAAFYRFIADRADTTFDSIRSGVAQAFSEFIWERDVSTFRATGDGVKEAVVEFLEERGDELLDRIAELRSGDDA